MRMNVKLNKINQLPVQREDNNKLKRHLKP